MKNFQLFALALIIGGSFLPLVRLPLIGTWNYWETHQQLAIISWVFSGVALLGIITNKQILVKFSAVVLLLIFAVTIVGIHFQASDFFSFIPFKKWQDIAVGSVKLGWGWIFEIGGAVLLLISKKNNK